MANSGRMSQLPIHQNYPSNSTNPSLYDPGTRNIARPPAPPPRFQNTTNSYSSPLNYNSYSGYNNYSGYGGYGGYSGGYSSFNRPLYSGYNSYSPYQSNYLSSFSGPRMPLDSQYSFTNEAQERSREAFANIERIVHTFGSVNMMIESTYYALQSSFNAVLSVVENISRLKSQFGQILSAFTLIRSIQWLYRKLLYLIGLRKLDPTTESAWKKATLSTFDEPQFEGSSSRSSWPMLVFIASIYLGPFLMWKFINLLRQNDKSTDDNAKIEDSNYYAIAKYDYKAQSPEELSFSAGEYLKLAPYEKQTDKLWPLASNGKRTGIVPVNYIDIKLNSVHTKNRQPNLVTNTSVPRPNEINVPNSQKSYPELHLNSKDSSAASLNNSQVFKKEEEREGAQISQAVKEEEEGQRAESLLMKNEMLKEREKVESSQIVKEDVETSPIIITTEIENDNSVGEK